MSSHDFADIMIFGFRFRCNRFLYKVEINDILVFSLVFGPHPFHVSVWGACIVFRAVDKGPQTDLTLKLKQKRERKVQKNVLLFSC